MTLNPMSYGEYIVHKTFGNKASNILDMQAMPYRTEELIRYLDQTRAIKRYHLEREAREAEEKFYKHVDKQINQTVEKAFDDMFKGWNK